MGSTAGLQETDHPDLDEAWMNDTPQRRKRVLMIAYHFPPDMEVGARRVERFVKYLPQSGWDPIVLSVHVSYYDSIDPAASMQPGVPVFRTRLTSGPREMARSLKARLFYRNKPLSAPTADVDPASAAGYIPPERISMLKRIFFSLMWLPDDRQGWLLPAVRKAIQISREVPIDVLYTTGPPWTNHLVGLFANVLLRKPWIVDFRDPWMGGRTKPVFVRSRLSDWLDSFLERQTLRRSTRIVCMCERQRSQLLQDHPGLDPRKVQIIPNGYDPDERPHLHETGSMDDGSMTMTYAGKLYFARDPRNFFIALDQVLKQSHWTSNQIRVRFFGKCSHVHGIPLMEIAEECGLAGVVETPGEIPRTRCLQELNASDLLLLFAMEQKDQVPAKLFEYLMMGKPILVFTETDSATAEVVRETGGGVIVDLGDVDSIASALTLLLNKHRTGTLGMTLNRSALERYASDALTQGLASTMETIVRLDRRNPNVRAGLDTENKAS